MLEYDELYKDLQPGLNVYWNGFGDPPSLTNRADFNDIEYNRKRQANRLLRKGRFIGGNLGWVLQEDFELFACLYCKPLKKTNDKQAILLDLIKHEGPLNIKLMKEFTGMLVKEITPALHRLQKAFLIYEDQYDGEWDRAWYQISEIFPTLDLNKYSRVEALKILLMRFSFRQVIFSVEMVKDYFKLPTKLIKEAIESLVTDTVLFEDEDEYMSIADKHDLEEYEKVNLNSVFALHRNDFLVKSNETFLKAKFNHDNHETLQYILIDGEFCGASVGKFRYGVNEIEDIILDLSESEIKQRRNEILRAVQEVNKNSIILRLNGVLL